MLRVASWNINGIRSPLQGLICQGPSNCPTALRRILDKLDADIVCLQETKVTRDVLTEPLAVVEGYNSYFSFSRSRSGYSGVATFCKDSATPVAAEEGLSGVFATQNGDVGCYGNLDEFTQEELRVLDSEGRAVLTQHKIRTLEGKEKTLTLINVYCPHADPGRPERLTFKMRFYRLLQIRAEALLAAGSHVIILGDLNTAHRPIDHCDAGSLECFEEDPGRTQLKILRFLVPLEQEPVRVQTVLQPSHQIQVQKHPSKARMHSTRPRKSQGVSQRNQKNLMSYFQPSSSLPQPSPDVGLPSLPLGGPLTIPKTAEEVTVVEDKVKVSEAKNEKEVRTSFWKSMLSGPSPMPLCGGHREPCVMRTVKKAGPNLGRQFYMCARPRGPPSDPSARCNFFLWSRPS
ncbi:DNA-(apurinic or apyrimidinic site) lyase 2 [Microtus ochrogaster]|uniref:DNA-(apurinic or apyrimidinic site) endonuclease 2 n=1 Tax=Microtus ochrogaster TaxID=79684 RepID=A0A8J6KVP7_MICOH|nr:DNA-(apurinic or apyrimidinic site) lyase 2 [Microtus ochrogaster]